MRAMVSNAKLKVGAGLLTGADLTSQAMNPITRRVKTASKTVKRTYRSNAEFLQKERMIRTAKKLDNEAIQRVVKAKESKVGQSGMNHVALAGHPEMHPR